MTRTASAHLGQLEAAYSEHVRALHAHLGVTAVVVPPGADDDILPGPPTEYHLRAQLESGVVVDAYEHVQWGIDPTAKCPDGRWAVPYEDLKAPCGLFAPRGLDRPGWWCVDVKRWELCALNDSLAERNARSAGHPARPVKITLRLGRLSDAKSTDRSPHSLVQAVGNALDSAVRARSA